MIRLSRGCYDKFHRCPGWVGGGNKYPKGDRSRCDNGRILYFSMETSEPIRLWKWRFIGCDTCNVVVWPYVTRYIDPTAWWVEIRYSLLRLQRWWSQ